MWLPGPGIFKFTILYLVLILMANLTAVAAAILSHRIFRERLFENYSRFALSLLPLTCMGFLALHVYYLFTLGPQMLALFGQYFGIDALGGSVSGTSSGNIRLAQEILIAGGSAWTLITMYRLGHSTPRGKHRRIWGILPHAIVAIIFTLAFISATRWAFPA